MAAASERLVQHAVPRLNKLQPRFTVPADSFTPDFFELNFWYLFAKGQGVVPEGLTEREFVAHCLRYHDRRFARCKEFIFVTFTSSL